MRHWETFAFLNRYPAEKSLYAICIFPMLAQSYNENYRNELTKFEPRHEISNNLICATSNASLRSAWAYMQSDQSFCWLLEYLMT